ncbi:MULTISPECIES: hypothetical protein [Pseudomonas]|uniref:Uncharacterized protein n=1 Tax=Pseudomonas luteola TaxID=47886 RepID=A0ABS0FPL8_PSELU|nr:MULTISPECIES: hypothetical protein [Pseudomonas]MBF8642254.1 hypothetical protein [Pseudomonas zeshuii]RRW48359.1 hypothetical protein EGJ50_10400 [Pseudomonas luteola]SHJ24782.1 hypothetical protein SAMN05216295_109241 [Pseudomonas zeshuii]
MSDQVSLSSFEAGVSCALAAITLYLKSRPDYDESALMKYVEFFKNTRQDAADKQAFEIALNVVGGDLSNIDEAIKQGVGSKPQ